VNGQRLSSRQLQTIWVLGRKLGADANTIRQRCLETHGEFPENLDRQQASQMISELAAEVDGERGAA
jgi:hypothetical protein